MRLNTEMVPSSEALARRVLSSRANLTTITGRDGGSIRNKSSLLPFHSPSLTSVSVYIKEMVHSAEGVVFCQCCVPSHGPANGRNSHSTGAEIRERRRTDRLA